MTEKFFAVLYVSFMGLTRCHKTTGFFTFIIPVSSVQTEKADCWTVRLLYKLILCIVAKIQKNISLKCHWYYRTFELEHWLWRLHYANETYRYVLQAKRANHGMTNEHWFSWRSAIMPAVVGVDNVAIVAGGVSRETRQQWPPNLLQIFNVCRFSGTFLWTPVLSLL